MAFVSQVEKRGEEVSYTWPNTREPYQEWYVRVDDVNDCADTVGLFTQVIKVGDIYVRGNDYDPGAWCRKVTIKADKNNDLLFIVRAEYSNEKPPEDPNPLLRGTQWSSYLREIELVLPYDYRGNPYTNPAGDPFDEPPPTIATILGFRMAKNVATYNPWVLASWNKNVNTDNWMGAAPGYAQVAGITPGAWQTEGSTTYAEIVQNVELNPYGWHPVKIMNKGPVYLATAGDFTTRTKANIEGDKTGDDVYLAVDGTLLAEGAAKTTTNRYPYPEAAFSGLPVQ